MAKAKNVLFIMCDQLRADYLSCSGIRILKHRTSTPSPRAAARLVKIFIGADFRKNSSVFITAISTLD